jgi:hypothetical protein
MIPDRSLVNTPEANEFVDNAKLETQRNVMLGNLNRFRKDLKDDPEIYNRVSASHQCLERAAETITRLASDGSRNEVEKHAAAKKVADDTIVQLDNTRQSLIGLSESYMRGVDERLADVFKLPEGRSAIQSDIARWIRDEAKNGDGGYTNIREAVTSNSEFAKVLYHWPTQLLGLPHDQRLEFVNKAIKVWSPECLVAMERSEMLRETAEKYPATIAKVKASFYNVLKAAKIHQRVAV